MGRRPSLVVRRVLPGRIVVVLFRAKYAVPRQIKPGIAKATYALSLFLLAAKKMAIIVSFW